MEEKTKSNGKRKTKQEKSLNRAFAVLATVIESMATGIKNDIDTGKKCEVKQIKELTGAAKELSSLLSTLSCENAPANEKHITVVFESEGEQWGK